MNVGYTLGEHFRALINSVNVIYRMIRMIKVDFVWELLWIAAGDVAAEHENDLELVGMIGQFDNCHVFVFHPLIFGATGSSYSSDSVTRWACISISGYRLQQRRSSVATNTVGIQELLLSDEVVDGDPGLGCVSDLDALENAVSVSRVEGDQGLFGDGRVVAASEGEGGRGGRGG